MAERLPILSHGSGPVFVLAVRGYSHDSRAGISVRWGKGMIFNSQNIQRAHNSTSPISLLTRPFSLAGSSLSNYQRVHKPW